MAFWLRGVARMILRTIGDRACSRVELLGHHRAVLADRLEDVAPDVAAEMPPGDAPPLLEFHDLVQDLVAAAEPHVHAELRPRRQAFRRTRLRAEDRVGAVDQRVLGRRGQQLEDVGCRCQARCGWLRPCRSELIEVSVPTGPNPHGLPGDDH